MFEKMVEFQNKEIYKAVLSVTLTIDVGTSESYKASYVHRQMLEYLGISDKNWLGLLTFFIFLIKSDPT